MRSHQSEATVGENNIPDIQRIVLQSWQIELSNFQVTNDVVWHSYIVKFLICNCVFVTLFSLSYNDCLPHTPHPHPPPHPHPTPTPTPQPSPPTPNTHPTPTPNTHPTNTPTPPPPPPQHPHPPPHPPQPQPPPHPQRHHRSGWHWLSSSSHPAAFCNGITPRTNIHIPIFSISTVLVSIDREVLHLGSINQIIMFNVNFINGMTKNTSFDLLYSNWYAYQTWMTFHLHYVLTAV